MYCTKCGKQLPDDCTDNICDDCKAAAQTAETAQSTQNDTNQTQQTQAQQVNAAYAPVQNTAYAQNTNYAQASSYGRMSGFGPALTSTILGTIGFIFACVALTVLSAAATVITTYSSYSSYYRSEIEAAKDVIPGSVVCLVFALALSIPSLILGIKSINTFKAAKNAGAVKPVPALILGIVGTACAAFSLFFVIIAFFSMVTVL